MKDNNLFSERLAVIETESLASYFKEARFELPAGESSEKKLESYNLKYFFSTYIEEAYIIDLINVFQTFATTFA